MGSLRRLHRCWTVLSIRSPAAGSRRVPPVQHLVLTTTELVARLAIRRFDSHRQAELSRWSDATYNDLLAFQGHPFLQFTGRPSIAPRGRRGAEPPGSPFNNFGFIGRDFTYAKSPGVVRIATLGGSTTMDGYPATLETFLNRDDADARERYEVMNFGISYWTSAHSLVDFVLNVVDFRPDYVVVHDGWNDMKVRHAGPDFRGDYSHALKVFEPPSFVPDRYLVRTSVIYRRAKIWLGRPDWAFLDNAVERQRDKVGGFENLDELKPFRRNIETLVHVAHSQGMVVVLLTVPRSRDSRKPYFYDAEHLDQANAVLRALAAEHQRHILFVDLDRSMTGKMESHFTDLGHLDEEGRAYKAEQVACAIQAHRRGSGSPR